MHQAYAVIQYAFAAMHRAYDCFHQACLPFRVYNLLPIVTVQLGVHILSGFLFAVLALSYTLKLVFLGRYSRLGASKLGDRLF